jgi:hypothetical protein
MALYLPSFLDVTEIDRQQAFIQRKGLRSEFPVSPKMPDDPFPHGFTSVATKLRRGGRRKWAFQCSQGKK